MVISHIESLKNSQTTPRYNYWELHQGSQMNFSDCHALNKYVLKDITFTLQPNRSLQLSVLSKNSETLSTFPLEIQFL